MEKQNNPFGEGFFFSSYTIWWKEMKADAPTLVRIYSKAINDWGGGILAFFDLVLDSFPKKNAL